jgi:molecular chaperone GrpE (heat shock protein)
MPKKTQPTNNEQQVSDDRIALLEAEIAGLTKQLADKEEIAKRAQSDYIRLKMDMDSYISRTESAQKEMKLQGLLDMAKKLLPSVYQLHLMSASCPEELVANSRAQGVKLLYGKLTKELELLHIFPIETVVGSEPNLTYHAPIGNEPVTDSKLTGKIVRELQQGYLYRKDNDEKVILPATVIVWA